jgi:cytochrome c
MKKIALAMLFAGVSLMASDGKALAAKCVACHGASFEKVALGKSAVVKGQSAATIETALKGYKAGTLNKNGMGALMKGQVATMSDADMKALAGYIAGL